MRAQKPSNESSVDTPFYKKSDLSAARIITNHPNYKKDKEKKIIKKIK
jgi:hypothetical protein